MYELSYNSSLRRKREKQGVAQMVERCAWAAEVRTFDPCHPDYCAFIRSIKMLKANSRSLESPTKQKMES